MIALCREHHDAADRGILSSGELRALKQSPLSVEDVKSHFPWAKREVLVRVGGVYCGGSSIAFAMNNQPVVHFTKDDHGLLLLSCDLRAPDGSSAISMEENMLLADPALLHDLEVATGATRIKAWFAKRNVGLELSFSA